MEILRANSPEEAVGALAKADAARRDGAWIAGYLGYELGAVLCGLPYQTSEAPLLLLGVFHAPQQSSIQHQGDARLSPRISRVSKKTYANSVSAIRAAIYEGYVYQVNLTVPFDARYDGDPDDLFALLSDAANVPYSAFVHDGKSAILSFSPELFLRIERGEILCKPMKGTAPLDQPEQLFNAKNRAEHLMIVDLVRNDLHRIARDIRVTHPFAIERFPTFATMTSEIRGSLDPKTPFLELLRATFPCGSITGAPKEAAMRAITEVETSVRGAYCGAIGYLAPHGDCEWNVAIRTLQLDTQRKSLRFDVGGGIVADSVATEEWSEINIKSKFLDAATDPLSIWETFAANDDRDPHITRMLATGRALACEIDEQRLRTYVSTIPLQPGSLVRLRAHADGRFSHSLETLTPQPETVRVIMYHEHVWSDDPFLGWKTSWRPIHQRAATYADERHCFDALLCNERGEITEGSRSSLFITRNGRLHTPPVECGLLPGILRARLLASGEAVETRLTPMDVANAESIFIGNAARGLLRADLVTVA